VVWRPNLCATSGYSKRQPRDGQITFRGVKQKQNDHHKIGGCWRYIKRVMMSEQLAAELGKDMRRPTPMRTLEHGFVQCHVNAMPRFRVNLEFCQADNTSAAIKLPGCHWHTDSSAYKRETKHSDVIAPHLRSGQRRAQC
jgi:hypothetical protein